MTSVDRIQVAAKIDQLRNLSHTKEKDQVLKEEQLRRKAG